MSKYGKGKVRVELNWEMPTEDKKPDAQLGLF